MDISVSPVELLDAIRAEFPREYEIAALRLANAKLSDRVAELSTTDRSAVELVDQGHGHTHPHTD